MNSSNNRNEDQDHLSSDDNDSDVAHEIEDIDDHIDNSCSATSKTLANNHNSGDKTDDTGVDRHHALAPRWSRKISSYSLADAKQEGFTKFVWADTTGDLDDEWSTMIPEDAVVFQVVKKIRNSYRQRIIAVSEMQGSLFVASKTGKMNVYPINSIVHHAKVVIVGKHSGRYANGVKIFLYLVDSSGVVATKTYGFKSIDEREKFLKSLSKLSEIEALPDNDYFLHGERVMHKIDKATYFYKNVDNQSMLVTGSLQITNYRILHSQSVEIPIDTIHETQSAGDLILAINTTDLRKVHFAVEGADRLKELIEERRGIVRNEEIFRALCSREILQGWALADPKPEFARIASAVEGYAFRVVDQGENYSICPSYPRYFLFPARYYESIKDIAKFRSSNRLPVVRWIDPKSHGVLCRSSQPMVGLLRHRSATDEALLDEYAKISRSGRLTIVDARGLPAIVGNRFQGKGTERIRHYKRCSLLESNIGNIHEVRENFFVLMNMIRSGVENPQSCDWTIQISRILRATATIVNEIHAKSKSVLVHCSDGFDRTPQLVCLAKMCLDPYYRTLKGFCELIQAEWCAYGHKFQDRNMKRMTKEYSPIFVQFLDVVHNVLFQHGLYYEFNELLLLYLAKNVYTSRFGTFFFNCEQDMMKANAMQSTGSIWSIVLDSRYIDSFRNTKYMPTESVLKVFYSPLMVSLWRRHLLRDRTSPFRRIFPGETHGQAILEPDE